MLTSFSNALLLLLLLFKSTLLFRVGLSLFSNFIMKKIKNLKGPGILFNQNLK